jgi:hypothetical protein
VIHLLVFCLLFVLFLVILLPLILVLLLLFLFSFPLLFSECYKCIDQYPLASGVHVAFCCIIGAISATELCEPLLEYHDSMCDLSHFCTVLYCTCIITQKNMFIAVLQILHIKIQWLMRYFHTSNLFYVVTAFWLKNSCTFSEIYLELMLFTLVSCFQ